MTNSQVKVIISAIDQVTGPLRTINSKITGMTRNVSASIGGLQSSVSTFTQQVGGLALAGGALAAAMISPASQMENLRVVLGNMMHSTEKANKVFEELKTYAVESPYSFLQLADSMRVLKIGGLEPMGQGFRDVMDYLGAFVPDAYRAQNATLALSQAMAKGKLMGNDFNQMADAGIPIMELLQKVTGKTTAQIFKMREAGELNGAVIKKLIHLMGQESDGAKAKIANLWTTVTSNLMDVWQIFSDTVLNTKTASGQSVFQLLKNDVVGLTNVMRTAMQGDNAKQFAQGFMDIYTGLKPIITDVLLPIGKAVVMVGKAFSDLVGGPGNAVKILLAVLFIPVLAALGGVITAVISLGGALAPVFAAIWVGGEALAGIGIMIGGFMPIINTIIGAAVVGLVLAVGKFKPLQDALSWVWNRLKDILGLLGKVAMAPINITTGVVSTLGNAKPISVGGGFKGSKFSASPRPVPKVAGSRNVVAIQPKQDNLNVHIKVDSVGRAHVAQVGGKGDSLMNFNADLGSMRAS